MLHSFTVFLIDDSVLDLALVQEALSRYGDRVTACTYTDGAAALTRLQDTGQPLPDVLVLDIRMPGMDGLELLRAIREDQRLRQLPVLILSDSSEPRDIDAARQLMATAYMVKPSTYDALDTQVATFIHHWMNRHDQQPLSLPTPLAPFEMWPTVHR